MTKTRKMIAKVIKSVGRSSWWNKVHKIYADSLDGFGGIYGPLEKMCGGDEEDVDTVTRLAMVGFVGMIEFLRDERAAAKEPTKEELLASEDERAPYDLSHPTQKVIEETVQRWGGYSHVLDQIADLSDTLGEDGMDDFMDRVRERLNESDNDFIPYLFVVGIMSTGDYLRKNKSISVPGVN